MSLRLGCCIAAIAANGHPGTVRASSTATERMHREMPLYTRPKVFCRLAEKLPPGSPTYAALPRFSEEADWAGLAAQRDAIFQIYGPTSPALRKMQSWPTEVWHPANASLAAHYGIRWLTLSDLHHLAVGDDPLVCVVCCR